MKDKYEAFLFGFAVASIIWCVVWAYVVGQIT